jgi:hypothetical protein
MEIEFDIISKGKDKILFQGKKEPIKKYFIQGAENEKLIVSFKSLLKIILGNTYKSSEFLNNFYSLVSKGVGNWKRQKFISKQNPSWNGNSLIEEDGFEEIILANKENEELKKNSKNSKNLKVKVSDSVNISECKLF